MKIRPQDKMRIGSTGLHGLTIEFQSLASVISEVLSSCVLTFDCSMSYGAETYPPAAANDNWLKATFEEQGKRKGARTPLLGVLIGH